ncbi:MAG: nicotinate phosphoribosyltransferase [Candidatus Hadarchaeales archaeon]
MRKFHIATVEEIKSGKTTDIYFVRTRQILEKKGMKSISALAEVTASSLPNNWPWAVLAGVEEVAQLFEDVPVTVSSMPEGTIFHPYDLRGFRVPVLTIDGKYAEYCEFETPMLGMLCQATGAATVAARIRKLAWGKTLIAFGIRRAHPAIAPMLDRAAYIGGFDGVSSLIGAETIGEKPMGTMPHSLIICFGDQRIAWKAFDDVMPAEIPRIALVDTYYDEKAEAIMAAETLGKKLTGVRLDTPGSRRGNMSEIVKEIRWELDVRGYKWVKIFVSGGISEKNIKELCEAGADGFGVGTSITNAPTVDFAMDIVELNGKPAAKRGKLGGRKDVWRCRHCLAFLLTREGETPGKCPKCGGKMEKALQPLVKDGKIVGKLPKPKEIRRYVLKQLERVKEI